METRPGRGARAGARRGPQEGRRCRWAWWATSPRCCRSWCAGASCPTCSPTRPRPTTCASATSRRATALRGSRRSARRIPQGYEDRVLDSMAIARAGDAGLSRRAAPWRSTTATTCAARWPTTGACARPSTSPASCPRTSGRCSAEAPGPFRWAALSGDPAGHRRHRPRRAGDVPQERGAGPLDPAGPEKVQFQGLPARICWLEYGERAEMGARFNWLVKNGQGGAPIVIGRDHLDYRLGGLAQPRDRGDEGRLRRHRRLAAAERAAQHRLRRQLGVAPPRRRRGHRLLDPRRHGGRGRRHRAARPTGSSGC